MARLLPFVDLEHGSFTVPTSRFIVRRSGAELKLFHIRYEESLEDCLVCTIRGSEGPVEARGGALLGDGFQIAILRSTVRIIQTVDKNSHFEVDCQNATAPDVKWHQLDGEETTWVFWSSTSEADDNQIEEHLKLTNSEFQESADRVVDEWMEKTPRALPHRQAMVDQCWWTLGTNTIDVMIGTREEEKRPATIVVPSKLGYVALWQWDTYFIALGLMHGDLKMALDQLDIAFFPDAEGQFPDVIHESGVLASSSDLPEADRVRLEEAGSQSGSLGPVPLTKPPLGAWAADIVTSVLAPEDRMRWIKKWFPLLVDNTKWWLTQAYSGYPIYAHPYSSGLDDCPVFDGALPVVSPDLIAYLQNQADVLARWTEELEQIGTPGMTQERRFLQDTAEKMHNLLNSLYEPESGIFRPVSPDGSQMPRTIVSLLSCFPGGLTNEQVDAICADVENPETFGSAYGLPTVARNEPSYKPERMWRGPIWINTNYLVASGLEACGATEEARQIRRKTLEVVETAGGPMEHFDPDTGKRAASATVNFGWSAALYIDLAIREVKEAER